MSLGWGCGLDLLGPSALARTVTARARVSVVGSTAAAESRQTAAPPAARPLLQPLAMQWALLTSTGREIPVRRSALRRRDRSRAGEDHRESQHVAIVLPTRTAIHPSITVT